MENRVVHLIYHSKQSSTHPATSLFKKDLSPISFGTSFEWTNNLNQVFSKPTSPCEPKLKNIRAGYTITSRLMFVVARKEPSRMLWLTISNKMLILWIKMMVKTMPHRRLLRHSAKNRNQPSSFSGMPCARISTQERRIIDLVNQPSPHAIISFSILLLCFWHWHR